MIYLMSQKFLKKNIEKMVGKGPYFILDGENYAVTGKTGSKDAIATSFNRCHPVGGFCPESRLYSMLKKMKDEEEVPQAALEREIGYFISDKAFIAAVCAAHKAVIAEGLENPMNIFVVVPNVVYAYLGFNILTAMNELIDVGFKTTLPQISIKENKKQLKTNFTKEEMSKINKATAAMETKHKLKYEVGAKDEYQ